MMLRLPNSRLSVAADVACETLATARKEANHELADLIEMDLCRVFVRIMQAGGPTLRKSVRRYLTSN